MVAGIVYAEGMNENERYLTEYDLAEPIERCCATYPEECEIGEEWEGYEDAEGCMVMTTTPYLVCFAHGEIA